MASASMISPDSIVETKANNKELLGFTKKLERSVQRISNGLSQSKTGALIQVWMPDVSSRGRVLLSTEGLPFSISGVGDLLALFRCISCKYRFSTDPSCSDAMGAVGRVYYYGNPEMCLDVQQYDKSIYLRISEAQLCRIHSTMILPVFDRGDEKAAAVMELSHHDDSMEFASLIQAFVAAFKTEGLRTADVRVDDWKLGLRKWPVEVCTVPLSTIEDTDQQNKRPYEQCISPRHMLGQAMQTGFGHVSDILMNIGVDSLSLHDQTLDGFFTKPYGEFRNNLSHADHTSLRRLESVPGVPAAMSRSISDSGSANTTTHNISAIHSPNTDKKPKEYLSVRQASVPAVSETEKDMQIDSPKHEKMTPAQLKDEDELVEDEEEEEGRDPEEDDEGSGVKKKENRLAGGAGKRLSYKDLEKFFGHGLKDASRRLGICPTTLKRACRRNGINRWPSRQISKLLKVWKQMGYKGDPPSWLLQNAISGNLRSENLAYILSAGLHVGLNPQQQHQQPHHSQRFTHMDVHSSALRTATHKTDFESGLYCTTTGQSSDVDHMAPTMFEEEHSLKNFTHHGDFTAALHGNDESVFGYSDHGSAGRMNHTWHAGQMANVILHPSSLSCLSESVTAVENSGSGQSTIPSHTAPQTTLHFDPELDQMKPNVIQPAASTVCDMERTQRGGNGMMPSLATEYTPSVDTEEYFLQTFQLPLGYESSQNLFH